MTGGFSVSLNKSINNKLDALASAGTVPSPLGVIADMSIDEEGDITQPSSTGASGTSQFFSRDDHVHPGDTTRAPIDSPVFLGKPTSAYIPDIDSDDANSFVLATTMFVRKLCLSLLNGSKSDTAVIIPPNSGEAAAPSQPGGNSENLSIGGGGLRGTGGSPGSKGGKGDWSSANNATRGGDGIDGTDGEKGSVMI
jgi:hypothetical protein